MLIDGAHYFKTLAGAFRRARRSILIVGWDFDARIKLEGLANEAGLTLGPYLRQLVEQNPRLEIRILIWSFSVIHSPGDPVDKLIGTEWQDHPRIQLRLDREHPFYASHHQKIVTVDDCLAFTGGIDLTVGRRDSAGHRARRLRVDPDGERYGPVHDMQAMVNGPAARALANIARARWKVATGEHIEACPPQPEVWENKEKADFEDSLVGIACTSPAWGGLPAQRLGVQLTKDMLKSARHSIYIEAQYFTAQFVADMLIPILQEREGPEIVLVLSANWHSKIEKRVLGCNCERLLRRLKRADRYHRLAAFYPQMQTQSGPVRVLVHAKLMIVDDYLLKVGSSNLNNRSIGLDSECDLVIQAQSEAHRVSIAGIRNRLLAEHLGTDPAAIAGVIDQGSSIIQAIGKFGGGDRALVPFDVKDGPTSPVFGTSLVDPSEPFGLLGWFRRTKPNFGAQKYQHT
jgi:phosphatidylserine/phosphatidylglycerophosphate/cardiolipin synthase-like enzyme